MNRPAVRDFALLVLRLVLGAVFVAHGYNHWFEMGMVETGRQFAALGVPQPAQTRSSSEKRPGNA